MIRIAVLLLSAGFASYVIGEKVVICYYGTWATYRTGLGKFDVGNINTALCTHVIYAFFGIDKTGKIVSLDAYLDFLTNFGKDNLRQFAKLKQKNSNIKLILAVGGWNEGSAKYSTMAASATYRKNFLNSATEWIKTYGFDGIDLDWEFPNQRDSVYGRADVTNYISLLHEMGTEFKKNGWLLTAAVAAQRDSISMSYDVPSMSKYLDFINIMAYDLNGSWDPVTGHNAPLHKGEGDTANREDLATVIYFKNISGAPPNKLTLGVPFYGHTFTLSSASSYGVRSPSNGPGIAGPYTATSGLIGYNEICAKFQSESWTKHYDSLAKVPYAHMNRNWVSYDNPDSITLKTEYALSMGLAGIMLWSIETDDFNNVCGGGNYPLLKAINKALASLLLSILYFRASLSLKLWFRSCRGDKIFSSSLSYCHSVAKKQHNPARLFSFSLRWI
ncbi:hypothetical protein K1T71_012596 [Dendrolimus kikuchii]|uniref:Uncharacterized protein n=1 Tax=Dendrolimus kikuchii TaxID=765133 RepID=A0ACC1CJR7_9NEOP|nr:hypothetical protein K1T71_012596 [Dendrolimus kikuchii]